MTVCYLEGHQPMPIPDFQSLMLPIMKIAADGSDHTARELREQLAEELGLSEQERKELLPSGQQPVFTNRLAWARSHLRMAGLLEKTGRGTFRITSRGQQALAGNPSAINLRFLQQFPEYLEARNKPRAGTQTIFSGDDEQTPQERLETAYQTLRANLAKDVLIQLKASTPDFFERVVVEVLVRMGYGGTRKDAGQAIGKSGDEGIDGIIKEDRLGLDIIYIQAKRWQNTVSRPEIQKFAGALQGQRAKKGIFITTSDFSKDAIEYAARIDSKIVLIDGDQLADLMIDHGVGVTPIANYEVKQIDADYFASEVA
jgi:restriction system protein